MSSLSASAPGKLVLSGEYAVLDGAAAIAVALDRRATVSIADRDSEYHAIRAPGYSDAPARFETQGEAIQWIDRGTDYSLFEALWKESRVSPSQPIEIMLDTRAFRDDASGRKLGIGSSAALSAALATALSRLGDSEPRAVAMLGHRRFQGGSGSGVDVATSLSGGIIHYRLGDDRPRALAWPQGLHYAVFWSGVSADTRARLERLGRQSRTIAGRRLIESADHVARVFAAGDAREVLSSLDYYCESLRFFDAEHALDIYAAGHDKLAESAADFGVVYKPCGAGGGDIGIALATSQDTLASFATMAGRAGFRRLDTTIDPLGTLLIEEDQA